MKPAALAKISLRWAVILLAPIALNVLVWAVVVVPARARLRMWRDAQVIAQLTPRFEEAFQRSNRALRDWDQGALPPGTAATVLQAIEQQAAASRVTISALKAATASAGPASPSASPVSGLVAVPVEMTATGSFGKLARWISALESRSAFQIDTWSLAPPAPDGKPCQLTLRLTAFLRQG